MAEWYHRGMKTANLKSTTENRGLEARFCTVQRSAGMTGEAVLSSDMLPSPIPEDDTNRMTQDAIIDYMPSV